MVQVAEDTGDSGLKCITVRMVEEKKALEEYNCSMVPVSPRRCTRTQATSLWST